jgi:hypothetical protein
MEVLEKDLARSTTLYVGNLSFFTTEEQIYQVFSKTGEIKRIIMGLDRNKKTPCGFCFVEYYTRKDCLDGQKFLNGTKVDERIVRTDVDPGFKPGRQFGRGNTGGQVSLIFIFKIIYGLFNKYRLEMNTEMITTKAEVGGEQELEKMKFVENYREMYMILPGVFHKVLITITIPGMKIPREEGMTMIMIVVDMVEEEILQHTNKKSFFVVFIFIKWRVVESTQHF